MKKIKLISEREFFKALEKPENFLDLNAKVVMHATETCYGLAADVFDERALNRLYKIKKMPATKPLSMMVRDLNEAEKYAEFSRQAVKMAEKFWPGPLTLVLPRKKMSGGNYGLPDFFNPEHETVGIRCPDSTVSRALINLNGRPMTTTSANISGRPEVYRVLDYLNQLQEYDEVPDMVIDGGEIDKKKPSTIVRIEGDEISILRRGDMADVINNYIVQELN